MTTPNNTVVGLAEKVREIITLLRQPEPDNGEKYTEFDEGYDQASGEIADMLERALASPAPSAPVVDDARAAFEKWAAQRHGCALDRWADSGKYRYDNTNAWWECWTAALSGVSAPVGVECLALLPWSDFWQSQGRYDVSHDFGAFQLAERWATACISAALTPPAAAPSAPLSVAGDAGELPDSFDAFQDAMEATHGYRPQVFAGVLMNSRDVDRFEGWELARRLATAEQPGSAVQGEADELLRELGLDPSRFRSEGGFLNAGKVRAALVHPEDYAGLYLPRAHAFAHSSKLGGDICTNCGAMKGTHQASEACITTPPPAPAAEQAYVPASPDSFDSHHNTATQPEARGVEGMVQKIPVSLEALSQAAAALDVLGRKPLAAWLMRELAAAPSGVRVDDAEARKLYAKFTDNHPTIHSNRFPAWSELSESSKQEWLDKAAAHGGK